MSPSPRLHHADWCMGKVRAVTAQPEKPSRLVQESESPEKSVAGHSPRAVGGNSGICNGPVGTSKRELGGIRVIE